MRSLIAILFLVHTLGLNTYAFAQDIPVTLPRLFTTEETSNVDVTVGDLTGKNIQSFSMTVTYDPAILEITRSVLDESLAAGFAVIDNIEEPGKITIAAASAQPVTGEGVLIRLRVHFIGTGTSNLNFESFTFNEGDPVAEPTNGILSNSGPVSNEDASLLPEQFELFGNYPNPFNPVTTIQFGLPEDAQVSLEVYDLLGRNVMQISGQSFKAGAGHQLQVDASSLPSGLYVYQLIAQSRSNRYIKGGKMTLLK